MQIRKQNIIINNNKKYPQKYYDKKKQKEKKKKTHTHTYKSKGIMQRNGQPEKQKTRSSKINIAIYWI